NLELTRLLGFEGLAFGSEACFEPRGAVAVDAGPRLGAVQITAPRARVRVLYSHEIEILLPMRPFLLQRRRAEAHLDPLHAAVLELTRLIHVSQILIARDRSFAERAVIDRTREAVGLSV